MFYQYDDSWISSANKQELREAIDEVYDEMQKYEFLSPQYNELSDLHNKLVKVWSTNTSGETRSFEHGWYLPEDD